VRVGARVSPLALGEAVASSIAVDVSP
jgi:hypothetical protein